ncbi:MAG: pyridoxal-phosphate dependent enzyme [Gammaproteobacteria bacterium]|nr:pyridoxal-phosphate dependent enzyme [Gammaproteobacteria bacterium]
MSPGSESSASAVDLDNAISPEAVASTAALIGPHIVRTPAVEWSGPELQSMLPGGTRVTAKLEVFQRSGTFKARGALSNILRLDNGQLQAGGTAMSAGNHAIAVAYAARAAGTHAKVVMQKSANPARVELARDLGAELLFADDGPSGFAMMDRLAVEEGRAVIHPFDGLATALGTATLGSELHAQAGDLDVLFVAIGGGGLAGGVSAITRHLQPGCRVIGVEPAGADSMHRSFASGKAENIGRTDTIADSLAPPMTGPIPYGLCRAHLDRLVLVSDAEMVAAMQLIFRGLKLAVEPACAATTAALVQLADELAGKQVGIILCGSNIDLDTYTDCCRAALD